MYINIEILLSIKTYISIKTHTVFLVNLIITLRMRSKRVLKAIRFEEIFIILYISSLKQHLLMYTE